MAIQARKTGSAASRRNNMQCLETPDKDTSIIQRPPSRGGMAFDIMVATPDTGTELCRIHLDRHVQLVFGSEA